MYTPEEFKTIGVFLGAAIIGRLLFYRSLVLEGPFKHRVKVRLLRWLWELPVIITIAFASVEVVDYFKFHHHTGIIVAIVLGYIGLESLKIWFDDYLEAKYNCDGKRRRRQSDKRLYLDRPENDEN